MNLAHHKDNLPKSYKFPNLVLVKYMSNQYTDYNSTPVEYTKSRNYAYALDDTRRDYDTIIKRYPLLTANEEWALLLELDKYKGTTRGNRIREKIVLHNMRYIIKVAHQCHLINTVIIDYNSLVHQCVVYFCEAIDRFDVHKGGRVRILSFAGCHLLHRLLRYVRTNRDKFATTALVILGHDLADPHSYSEQMRYELDYEAMRLTIRRTLESTITDTRAQQFSLPITLYRVDNPGASNEEIAAHFGTNERAVRRCLTRSYKKIKPILSKVL
jgi:hypothetical protein